MPESTSSKRRSGARRSRLRRRDAGATHNQVHPGTLIGAVYNPLTNADADRVHRTALDLLQQVGMAKPTPRVAELALQRGCSLSSKGRLLFPRTLVEDMLAQAANEFVVHGRDPAFDFEAGNGKVNFCTGGAAIQMLDSDTRQYRPSQLDDLYDLSRLCDRLEHLQWFTRPIVATDLADNFELDVNTIYACAAGTRKHIATSFSRAPHVERVLPLLDALAGGDGQFAKRPFCTVHATTVVSPMSFAEESLEVACAAVDIGMPVHVQTGPQAGATAPAALAGTLAQVCAEGLASLTIINLLKPGYPVMLGNWAFVSDLRTAAFSGGSGEQALLGAASGQMARFYGVPGGMGAGMTDSKLPDNQAGFEKALSLALAALSGSGFVFESAGMLASLLGCSHEAMVIDDEMLASIRRIARGIEVNDETLSLDVIKSVVHGPGHFLGAAQTLQLMESEYVYPKISDRTSPGAWQADGASDIWQRAHERVAELLRDYFPLHIDAATDRALRARFPIKLTPHWLDRGSA